MKSATLLVAAVAIAACGFASAQSGVDLVKSKNCLACHTGEKKPMAGPAFKDVAAKYKGDKGAADKLVADLKDGPKAGKGHPIKVAGSEGELKAMVAHVLAEK